MLERSLVISAMECIRTLGMSKCVEIERRAVHLSREKVFLWWTLMRYWIRIWISKWNDDLPIVKQRHKCFKLKPSHFGKTNRLVTLGSFWDLVRLFIENKPMHPKETALDLEIYQLKSKKLSDIKYNSHEKQPYYRGDKNLDGFQTSDQLRAMSASPA